MSQNERRIRLGRVACLIFWLVATGGLLSQASSIFPLRFERALILSDSARQPLILSQSIAAFGGYEVRLLLAPDGEYARLFVSAGGRCMGTGLEV